MLDLKKFFKLAAASVPDSVEDTQSKNIGDYCRDQGTEDELAALIRENPASINHTSALTIRRRLYVQMYPIHLAATAGKTGKMKILLDAGADIDAPMTDGFTVLMLAARSKNAETMAFAFAHSKADINARQETSERTALIEACIAGDAGVVREILKHNPDITFCPPYGAPALNVAAQSGHTDIVQLLIDAGADIDQPDHSGRTALWWALHCKKADTVECLLRHHADTQATDHQGCTILMKAAAAGYAPLVKNLLIHGADPNQEDQKKNTALHHAVLDENTPDMTDVLEVLIRRGAHTGMENCLGDTPLALADRLHRNNRTAVAFLQKQPVTIPKIKTDHFTKGSSKQIQTLKTIRLRPAPKHSRP